MAWLENLKRFAAIPWPFSDVEETEVSLRDLSCSSADRGEGGNGRRAVLEEISLVNL